MWSWAGAPTGRRLGRISIVQSGEPRPHPTLDHAYAILRIDGVKQLSPTVDLQCAINGNKIMWDQVSADAEVARLNALKGDADTIYILQLTRVERRT